MDTNGHPNIVADVNVYPEVSVHRFFSYFKKSFVLMLFYGSILHWTDVFASENQRLQWSESAIVSKRWL